jgi:hypothetical protein
MGDISIKLFPPGQNIRPNSGPVFELAKTAQHRKLPSTIHRDWQHAKQSNSTRQRLLNCKLGTHINQRAAVSPPARCARSNGTKRFNALRDDERRNVSKTDEYLQTPCGLARAGCSGVAGRANRQAHQGTAMIPGRRHFKKYRLASIPTQNKCGGR